MNLSDLFSHNGFGVMATADAQGHVNTAVYARPRVIDETTLVWGMTDRRTFRNVSLNPRAAFLFKSTAPGFVGARLSLELIRTEDDGELLAAIKNSTEEIVGPGAGALVTHAVWFRVTEVRPLV